MLDEFWTTKSIKTTTTTSLTDDEVNERKIDCDIREELYRHYYGCSMPSIVTLDDVLKQRIAPPLLLFESSVRV